MRNIVSPLEGIRSPFGPRYGGFSPASLFAASEPGVWYDPSDFSTMFQNAAGTTPVTAVEQPVGLLLDKSQGLVLGSELVDTANSAASWTVYGTNTVTQDGDAVKVTYVNDTQGAYFFMTAAGGLSTNLTIGKTYLFTCEAKASGGTVSVAPFFFNGSSTGAGSVSVSSTSYTTVTFRLLEYTGGSPFVRLQTPVGTIGWIRNISVRELPGNHATQSTTASRPVLSARVNQLTYSEAIAISFLTTAATLTNNQAVTPSGAPASRIVPSVSFGTHGVYFGNALGAGTFTFSLEAKSSGYPRLGLRVYDGSAYRIYATIDLTTGATVSGSIGTVTTTNLGNEWWRISVTSTPATGSMGTTTGWVIESLPSGTSVQGAFTGDGTSGAFVSKVDIRVTVGVNLPAYQRIAAATDYDTTGFPYYLKFDGTDDSMATGTITPETDKAQVFAGVRKQSDAAFGMIVEGNTTGDGKLYLGNQTSGIYQFYSRGTADAYAAGVTAFSAPSSNVISGLGDISGPFATVRVNGVTRESVSSSQGTGNYAAQPLYIGSRAGSSLRFNGNIYSLIARFGSNLDAATISNTETWVNGKTLAY